MVNLAASHVYPTGKTRTCGFENYGNTASVEAGRLRASTSMLESAVQRNIGRNWMPF
jgi:hypothetical protein